MNTILTHSARIVLAGLVLASLWLINGCASPSLGGALTLKQTQLDVDWKLTAYQQIVPLGSVTLGQAQQVASARKAYDEAFQQALKNANGNLDAPTPANVQQRANQLIQVISAVLATTT